MKIEEHATLWPKRAREAWELYERIFTPVNELAAQRHLMTFDEFDGVAANDRIAKYLAHTDDGALVGMSVITNDLDAWPLISPAFFAKRYPEHYAQRRIFYVGFVGVADWLPGTAHVFSGLIGAMQPQVDACAGIAVMDYCALNVDVRKLPRAAWAVQTRLSDGPVVAECVDRQEFWAYDHGMPRG